MIPITYTQVAFGRREASSNSASVSTGRAKWFRYWGVAAANLYVVVVAPVSGA